MRTLNISGVKAITIAVLHYDPDLTAKLAHRPSTVARLRRRTALALCLVWAAALLAAPALAKAPKAAGAATATGDWRDWFTLLPKVAAQWEVFPAEGPGKRVEIRHKACHMRAISPISPARLTRPPLAQTSRSILCGSAISSLDCGSRWAR